MTLPIDPNSTVRIDAPTGVVQVVPAEKQPMPSLLRNFHVPCGPDYPGDYYDHEGRKWNPRDRGGSCRVCGAAALFKNHICPSCERKRATA